MGDVKVRHNPQGRKDFAAAQQPTRSAQEENAFLDFEMKETTVITCQSLMLRTQYLGADARVDWTGRETGRTEDNPPRLFVKI